MKKEKAESLRTTNIAGLFLPWILSPFIYIFKSLSFISEAEQKVYTAKANDGVQNKFSVRSVAEIVWANGIQNSARKKNADWMRGKWERKTGREEELGVEGKES